MVCRTLFARFFLASFTVFYLAGCHQTPKHTDDILTNPWTPVTNSAKEKLYTAKPLYCYATLGTPECYHIEQYSLSNRLQGEFVPLEPRPTTTSEKEHH